MTGRKLGAYEFVEKLGQGGMGEVWKARDMRLNRMAAIKILPAAKLSTADQRQRFLQEAQAASALNHPNIITIYGRLEKPVKQGLSVAPDGRSVLYSQIDSRGSEIMLVENFR